MVVMNLKSCELVQPLVLVVLVIVKATIGLLLLPLVNPTFVSLMMSSCRSCNETNHLFFVVVFIFDWSLKFLPSLSLLKVFLKVCFGVKIFNEDDSERKIEAL